MKQFERFGLLKNYITHLVKLIYKRNKETILNRANVYCKKKTKKN